MSGESQLIECAQQIARQAEALRDGGNSLTEQQQRWVTIIIHSAQYFNESLKEFCKATGSAETRHALQHLSAELRMALANIESACRVLNHPQMGGILAEAQLHAIQQMRETHRALAEGLDRWGGEIRNTSGG